MLAAFYNGFPLVYSDTSTYLASGFELETPADRPITYGLFVRITSLNGLSLWGTVFFQSLLLGWLAYKLFQKLGVSRPERASIVTVLICTLSTGVSWVSSQLIADVFTPILILSWAIILLDKGTDKRRLVTYYVILFFATAMHISHFFMTLGLLPLLLLVRFNNRFKPNLSWKKLGCILLVTLLTFPVFASSYSKYSSVFFVSRLDDSGLLKEILDDHCGEKNFKMCQYKDSLPHNAVKFLWDANSPLQKMGGYKGAREEFKEIRKLSLNSGKYLKRITTNAITDSWRQLFRFDIDDGNGIFMEGSRLYERIKQYAPRDAAMYAASRQQSGGLSLEGKFVFYFRSVLSLAVLIGIALLFIKKPANDLFLLALLILAGVVLNACICGAFSVVTDRYQCRVAWLLVFLFFGLLFAGRNKEDRQFMS